MFNGSIKVLANPPVTVSPSTVSDEKLTLRVPDLMSLDTARTSATPKPASLNKPESLTTLSLGIRSSLPTLGASCTFSCQGSHVRCIDSVCQESWQSPEWTQTGSSNSLFDGWNVQDDAWNAGRSIVQNPDSSNATDLVLMVKFPAGSRNPAHSPQGGTGVGVL